MEPQNNNPEQDQAVQQLVNYTAVQLMQQKRTNYEVRQELMSKGMDEANAAALVDGVEQKIREAKKSKAQKDIIYGLLWCVGGILVTVLTYNAAQGGGRYVVAWGAILFGGVQFIRGLVNSAD